MKHSNCVCMCLPPGFLVKHLENYIIMRIARLSNIRKSTPNSQQYIHCMPTRYAERYDQLPAQANSLTAATKHHKELVSSTRRHDNSQQRTGKKHIGSWKQTAYETGFRCTVSDLARALCDQTLTDEGRCLCPRI